jgi:hypothetical protein
MANGNPAMNGTSEQRQRDLDHDEPTEDSSSPGSSRGDGGKVLHVEPEELRPTTVTLPSERDPEGPVTERDLGGEFQF